MASLDHSLIYNARKYITGENTHFVKTWIFCYETSLPNSARRDRYEKLLREFVASERIIEAARRKVQAEREYLTKINN